MNLLFGRSQQKTMWGFYRFELWACFDLTHNEKELVSRYNVADTILSEGDLLRDLKRSVIWAAAGALLVMLIDYTVPYLALIGLERAGLAPTILLGLISFVVLTWFIYHQIREEIRVRDLLVSGRRFACRSVLRLVEKEELLIVMAAKFRYFLETMKTWDKEEVIPIELPPKPGLRLDPPRAAA